MIYLNATVANSMHGKCWQHITYDFLKYITRTAERDIMLRIWYKIKAILRMQVREFSAWKKNSCIFH